MAQGLPAYTRLPEESDEEIVSHVASEELVSPVTNEEMKPPEPPSASQTPAAAETEEKAPEEAPPVQPGYQPAVPTPGYQPTVPMGVPPGYQPVGMPPAVAATALNTTTVVQMQPTVGMAVLYPQNKPENYLVLSVFSMLCCCFIFGLIGLIYSLRVNSSWNVGDYEGAMSSSKTAKHWNIAAIVTGGIFAAIGGIAVLIQLIGFTVFATTRQQ